MIVLHGIFSDAANMNDLINMITTAHPGTPIYNIDGYDDARSMEGMWTQVDYFKKKMLPIFKNSSQGVNMICFSQGEGLLNWLLRSWKCSVIQVTTAVFISAQVILIQQRLLVQTRTAPIFFISSGQPT